jgi:hypothetical protein
MNILMLLATTRCRAMMPARSRASEVERYTKAVDQMRLSENALAKTAAGEKIGIRSV